MENRITIKIVKTTAGYVCMTGDGSMHDAGRVYFSKALAYRNLEATYNNSEWKGKKVRGGYSICMDTENY